MLFDENNYILVDEDEKRVNLELHCDLKQAANFYNVEIDEIELRNYITSFSISQENSNSVITVECRGCNELINAHVIEFPRINNFRSSNFIVQILIIVGIILLPFVRINISDFAIYVLVGFGLLVFLNDVYSFMFKPPARLDTLFYWHNIKEVKGSVEDLEKKIEEINLTDEEIWAIHEKLTQGKVKGKTQVVTETTQEFEVETQIKDGEITTKTRKLPDINIPIDEEEIDEEELENLTIEEIRDILEYDVLGSTGATFSEDFTENMDLNEIAKLLVGEVKLNKKGSKARDLFATIMKDKISELNLIQPNPKPVTKRIQKKAPNTLFKKEFAKFRKDIVEHENDSAQEQLDEQEKSSNKVDNPLEEIPSTDDDTSEANSLSDDGKTGNLKQVEDVSVEKSKAEPSKDNTGDIVQKFEVQGERIEEDDSKIDQTEKNGIIHNKNKQVDSENEAKDTPQATEQKIEARENNETIKESDHQELENEKAE